VGSTDPANWPTTTITAATPKNVARQPTPSRASATSGTASPPTAMPVGSSPSASVRRSGSAWTTATVSGMIPAADSPSAMTTTAATKCDACPVSAASAKPAAVTRFPVRATARVPNRSQAQPVSGAMNPLPSCSTA
jgi:hypothetical protein